MSICLTQYRHFTDRRTDGQNW